MMSTNLPEGTTGADGPDTPRTQAFGGREWGFLISWPWALAAIVALVATGSGEWGTGGAAAVVLAGGMVLLAFVGAPMLAGGTETPGGPGITARAGMLAALSAALALPALVAVTLASRSASGTVPCGALLVALAAYGLVRAAALGKGAYPAVAALWIGGPPFVHYVLRDVLGQRADWVLALGPASGAVWVVRAPSAWERLWWPATVLLLAGAALTVAGGGRRDVPKGDNASGSAP